MKQATFDAVYNALSKELTLDKARLDEQLCEHAELFRKACDLHSQCEDLHDEATRVQKEVEAEVDREIREDSAAAKGKTTETDIKRRILVNERVVKATTEVAMLKANLRRARDLRDSWLERRYAFTKLVDLHGQQYWGDVPASRDRTAAGARRERVGEAYRERKRL